MEVDQYMVCTRCMTYNQAPFIEKTMQGFCSQETTFSVVYCIVDDASTDGEQDVIMHYLSNNFNVDDSCVARHEETQEYVMSFAQHKSNVNCYFAVLFLKTNHKQTKTPKLKYIAEWHNASKYIAICEGDDYWIDKAKLQQQVDIMEHNSRIGLCYTNAYTYIQNRNRLIKSLTDFSYKGLKELIFINPIMTLTTLYRKTCYNLYLEEIDPKSRGWLMGDYPMWLWFAANTEVYHLDVFTAVYRQCENSVSHSTNAEKQIAFLKSIHNVQYFFAEKYLPTDKDLITRIEDRTNARIAIVYDKHGDRKKYLEFAKKISVKSSSVKKKIFLYSIPIYYSSIKIIRAFRKKAASYLR